MSHFLLLDVQPWPNSRPTIPPPYVPIVLPALIVLPDAFIFVDSEWQLVIVILLLSCSTIAKKQPHLVAKLAPFKLKVICSIVNVFAVPVVVIFCEVLTLC